LTVAEIRRLIEEADRVPVERDTLYHQVVRGDSGWQTGEAIPLAGMGAPDVRPVS
jgi:aminodeoxyfutalosine synthase